MSELLFSYIGRFFFREDVGCYKLVAAGKSLPYSLRGIQNSFGSLPSSQWTLGLFIIIISTVMLVAMAWYFSRIESKAHKVKDNNPEKLFDDLLGVINLSESDKRLLRQMASQSRLKHPAMCLLSPELLEWSHELWVKEKGRSYVTEAKSAHVREIAVKLYDHHGSGHLAASSL